MTLVSMRPACGQQNNVAFMVLCVSMLISGVIGNCPQQPAVGNNLFVGANSLSLNCTESQQCVKTLCECIGLGYDGSTGSCLAIAGGTTCPGAFASRVTQCSTVAMVCFTATQRAIASLTLPTDGCSAWARSVGDDLTALLGGASFDSTAFASSCNNLVCGLNEALKCSTDSAVGGDANVACRTPIAGRTTLTIRLSGSHWLALVTDAVKRVQLMNALSQGLTTSSGHRANVVSVQVSSYDGALVAVVELDTPAYSGISELKKTSQQDVWLGPARELYTRWGGSDRPEAMSLQFGTIGLSPNQIKDVVKTRDCTTWCAVAVAGAALAAAAVIAVGCFLCWPRVRRGHAKRSLRPGSKHTESHAIAMTPVVQPSAASQPALQPESGSATATAPPSG